MSKIVKEESTIVAIICIRPIEYPILRVDSALKNSLGGGKGEDPALGDGKALEASALGDGSVLEASACAREDGSALQGERGGR